MLFKGIMSGLNPGNNLYYYSVGSTLLGYSEVLSFKSHPGNAPNTTFFIVGDLGQTSNSQTTLAELSEAESLLVTPSAGIVNAGDLSYANGKDSLWDSFGNMKQFAVSHIPMMTTLGNHEWFDDVSFSFTAYLNRYDNPRVEGKRELYYSFDAGLAHWVMVAGYCSEMKLTTTQPCLAADSPQLAWLQNDLANVNRDVTPWVIVVFHQPFLNSNTAHSMKTEGYPMQEAIEDTLYQYKVDLVFSGHVHAYERSCQVYKYKCTNGAPTYITIGDGGNAEGLATDWINPQPSWSLFRQASYGFGALQVINATHARWAWHQNADLIPAVSDEMMFTKTSPALRGSVLKQFTLEPVFAQTRRGELAKLFNQEAAQKSLRSHH